MFQPILLINQLSSTLHRSFGSQRRLLISRFYILSDYDLTGSYSTCVGSRLKGHVQMLL